MLSYLVHSMHILCSCAVNCSQLDHTCLQFCMAWLLASCADSVSEALTVSANYRVSARLLPEAGNGQGMRLQHLCVGPSAAYGLHTQSPQRERPQDLTLHSLMPPSRTQHDGRAHTSCRASVRP